MFSGRTPECSKLKRLLPVQWSEKLGGIIVSSGDIEEEVLDCALKTKERVKYWLRKLLTAGGPVLGLAKNLEAKNMKRGSELAIKALSAAQAIGDSSDRGNKSGDPCRIEVPAHASVYNQPRFSGFRVDKCKRLGVCHSRLTAWFRQAVAKVCDTQTD